MKINIKRLIVLFFVLTIVFISCKNELKKDHFKELKWMSKISGVKIPKNVKNINLYNNHEWGMITKFNLDSTDFESFYKQNNLSSLKTLDIEMNLLNDIENLPLDKQFIKEIHEYGYFEDCKIGNSWSILGNLKTNTIWFEVLYPDNGGNINHCNNISKQHKKPFNIDSKSFENYIDSLENNNNLIEYKHPDLTVWGGLKSYSFNNKIIKIIARHNAELGFTENQYLLYNNDIIKIKKILHWAQWKKYRDKYGDKLIPKKMTYLDSIIVFNYNQEIELDSTMINELNKGKDLIKFFKN